MLGWFFLVLFYWVRFRWASFRFTENVRNTLRKILKLSIIPIKIWFYRKPHEAYSIQCKFTYPKELIAYFPNCPTEYRGTKWIFSKQSTAQSNRWGRVWKSITKIEKIDLPVIFGESIRCSRVGVYRTRNSIYLTLPHKHPTNTWT